ncbi:M15 family metallopeptidase [Nocardioides caldifontis]|uniref:M15 family metallopeptidase n=1 Tax=Nocardioides caldifontis TaxID=2588938 RepID=UPI0011E06288|nr:M15 family metallopeptidase [Nocardioides caldifontis]
MPRRRGRVLRPATGRGRRTRAAAGLGAALVAAALVAGCSDQPTTEVQETNGSPVETPAPDDSGEVSPSSSEYAVEPPDPEEGSALTADVLIVSQKGTLPDEVVERVRSLESRGKRIVEAALPISVGVAPVNGKTLTVAAVDPGEFRRFTPNESRTADFVWERLAGGEAALDIDTPKKVVSEGDMITLGVTEDTPELHVGAYAPLVDRRLTIDKSAPAFHALVNDKRGEQLGIPHHNALLVSTGTYVPSKFEKQFKRVIGGSATFQALALELDTGLQSAVLIGTNVSDAVGTFSYTNGPDGTINPDPAWVEEYIRTEEVPILGTVTCNKAYLPQLRAALQEIVASGLADEINPDEYAGCYYPRYIGRDPSNGLSLHSWGIAVDINVPGNLRGTVGEIDRGVVTIMKKWGMDWGGDWNYTDPMHFEMSSVVRPG